MKKHVKLLVLILWMAAIFAMSAEAAPESEETSNFVTEIIYRIYAFFSSNPINGSLFIERYAGIIRKLAHFTEFMILGFLSVSNAREYFAKNYELYGACFGILYAISDEIHQLFVENRCCSIKDVLIDSAGIMCGIFLYRLISKKWKKDY